MSDNPWIAMACACLAAYLVGGIPFGYLIGKIKGIDIRQQGSGNIGATNVFRVLGKKWGTLALLADMGKGAIPLLALIYYIQGYLGGEWRPLVIGLFIVVGHNFTPFLGFRGGKGIATSAGVLLGLMPLPLALALVTWLIFFGVSRIVSLASLAASLALPIGAFIFLPGRWLEFGLAVALCIMSFVRHKSNIERLMAGKELGFSKKTNQGSDPS